MATIREYETAKGKRFEVGYTKPDGERRGSAGSGPSETRTSGPRQTSSR